MEGVAQWYPRGGINEVRDKKWCMKMCVEDNNERNCIRVVIE